MSIKWLYIVVMVFLIQFTNGYLSDDKIEYVKASILSKEFDEYFHLCSINENNIIIYNDTEIKINLTLKKCDKNIKVKNIDFAYNVNIPLRKQTKRKIVLYKMETKKESVKLYYLCLPDNGVLTLEYNDKLKLIALSEGVF